MDADVTIQDYTYVVEGLKSNSNSKKPYVEGFISTNEPDLYDEIVPEVEMDNIVNVLNQGNFKLDLDHSLFRGGHEGPIGRIVEAKKLTENGKAKVWVKALLNVDHPQFDVVWKQINNKFIDAFSIAYKAGKEMVQEGNKMLTKLVNINLLNVALTGDPVNGGARMTGFGLKHKYIKREGSSGNYKYVYQAPEGKESSGNSKEITSDSEAAEKEIKILNHVTKLLENGTISPRQAVGMVEPYVSKEAYAVIEPEINRLKEVNVERAKIRGHPKKELLGAMENVANDFIKEGQSVDEALDSVLDGLQDNFRDAYESQLRENLSKKKSEEPNANGISESTIDDIETDLAISLKIERPTVTKVSEGKDGKKVIKLTSPDGDLQVVLNKDGSLEGPEGILKDHHGREFNYKTKSISQQATVETNGGTMTPEPVAAPVAQAEPVVAPAPAIDMKAVAEKDATITAQANEIVALKSAIEAQKVKIAELDAKLSEPLLKSVQKPSNDSKPAEPVSVLSLIR